MRMEGGRPVIGGKEFIGGIPNGGRPSGGRPQGGVRIGGRDTIDGGKNLIGGVD